jgi:cysteinyl-tRNA synthetase
MKYLGETLDIHSGGLDHIPVHHENEIAQSESASGHPFVRYFVHNAFLTGMAGAKISKSAGKFPVVADLQAAGIDPVAFRLFCYSAKYRSELAFSIDSVRAAESNLTYMREFVRNLPPAAIDSARDVEWAAAYEERFGDALRNDLNTAQALAVALEMVAETRRQNDQRVWKTLQKFDQVLGLDLATELDVARGGLPQKIKELMTAREEARAAKDFKRSDELRHEIDALGYEVKDTKVGMVIMRKRLP